jgi:SH3 domain
MAAVIQQHHSPTRTISTVASAVSTNSFISTNSSNSSLPARPRQNSTATVQLQPALQQQQQQPLIVRALYDYHSPDPTNLSFQAGTLIRVLTQLQSGWWDGCIDGERGWFPCNFVTEIDESQLAEEEEDFLDDPYSTSEDGEGEGERALDEDLVAEEFAWIPQADSEGRTFYLNTVNGNTSWELPTARVYMEDWEDQDQSDEEGAPRSSMDSEASEDILMLGPIAQPPQQSYIEPFNV